MSDTPFGPFFSPPLLLCASPSSDRAPCCLADPFTSLAKTGGYESLAPALNTVMEKPKIIAYLKPSCGWSQGVRAVLRKYDLPFEDRDIINDPVQRQEMVERSGQMLSPCVEVNGRMLPDISGDEVEAFLLAQGLVTPNSKAPDAPTNQPCAHEMPQASNMNFRR